MLPMKSFELKCNYCFSCYGSSRGDRSLLRHELEIWKLNGVNSYA